MLCRYVQYIITSLRTICTYLQADERLFFFRQDDEWANSDFTQGEGEVYKYLRAIYTRASV